PACPRFGARRRWGTHNLSLGGYCARSIENGRHWVLDVVFREDDSRARAGHAGANLALLRREAVSLLKRAPGQGTTPTKRLKADWDDEYLLQVLQVRLCLLLTEEGSARGVSVRCTFCRRLPLRSARSIVELSCSRWAPCSSRGATTVPQNDKMIRAI